MYDNKAIGNRIKQARKSKQITQKQLANIINKTESSIQKYECGSTEVPYSVLQQIAKALDVKISKLIFDEYTEEIYKPSYSLREQAEHATIVKTENETFQNLAISFSRLTNEGQQKVADYADDLTKIPQYQRHED